MIDTGPARITGPLRGAKYRIIWTGGTLYVVDGSGKIKTYSVPEEPKRRNSGFTFETADGVKGTFYRSGCNCRYPQQSISRDEIVGA